MNKKYILSDGTTDNCTNKLFICTDGCNMGKGKTLTEAYRNYYENGSDSFDQCTFYEASEIKVELKAI